MIASPNRAYDFDTIYKRLDTSLEKYEKLEQQYDNLSKKQFKTKAANKKFKEVGAAFNEYTLMHTEVKKLANNGQITSIIKYLTDQDGDNNQNHQVMQRLSQLIAKAQECKDENKHQLDELKTQLKTAKKFKHKIKISKQIVELTKCVVQSKSIISSFKNPLKQEGIVSHKSFYNAIKYICETFEELSRLFIEIFEIFSKNSLTLVIHSRMKKIYKLLDENRKHSVQLSVELIHKVYRRINNDDEIAIVSIQEINYTISTAENSVPELPDLQNIKRKDLKKKFEELKDQIQKAKDSGWEKIVRQTLQNGEQNHDKEKLLQFVFDLAFYVAFQEKFKVSENVKVDPILGNDKKQNIWTGVALAGILIGTIGALLLSILLCTWVGLVIAVAAIASGAYCTFLVTSLVLAVCTVGGFAVGAGGAHKEEQNESKFESLQREIKIFSDKKTTPQANLSQQSRRRTLTNAAPQNIPTYQAANNSDNQTDEAPTHMGVDPSTVHSSPSNGIKLESPFGDQQKSRENSSKSSDINIEVYSGSS